MIQERLKTAAYDCTLVNQVAVTVGELNKVFHSKTANCNRNSEKNMCRTQVGLRDDLAQLYTTFLKPRQEEIVRQMIQEIKTSYHSLNQAVLMITTCQEAHQNWSIKPLMGYPDQWSRIESFPSRRRISSQLGAGKALRLIGNLENLRGARGWWWIDMAAWELNAIIIFRLNQMVFPLVNCSHLNFDFKWSNIVWIWINLEPPWGTKWFMVLTLQEVRWMVLEIYGLVEFCDS